MEAKYRARQPDLEGPASVIAAVVAMILLAVVISAAVIYFIGSTLPYAGSPDYAPSPIHVGSAVDSVVSVGDVVDLPALP